MLTPSQKRALFRQAHGHGRRGLAAELAAVDRTPGQPQLERLCELLSEELGRIGADTVELANHAWGPEQRYFGWAGERVPRVEEAELYLVEATGEERLLCRASEEPSCCLGALRPTAGDGETFEVVSVGYGTLPGEYRRLRMTDKVALASGHHAQGAIFEALSQRDAAGLLLGPGGARERVPHRFEGPGYLGPQRPFGFNLEPAQYHLLQSRLAAGETLRVRVRTVVRLDSGQRPLVLATLQGSDRRAERITLVADLCEPGEGGSVLALLHTLAALRNAVVAGDIAPPRRSIELAFVSGPSGTVSWLATAAANHRLARALVQLSLPRRRPAPEVSVHPVAPDPPSFLGDLVFDQLQLASAFDGPLRAETPLRPRLAPRPHSAALPLDGVAAAVVLASGGQATPGTESATAIPVAATSRVVAAATLAAAELASLDEHDVPALLAAAELGGSLRLEQRAQALRRQMLRELDTDDHRDAWDLLWQMDEGLRLGSQDEHQRLRSVTTFFGGPGAEALQLAEAEAALDRQSERLRRTLAAEVRGRVGEHTKLVVKRRPLSPLERRAQKVRLRRPQPGPLPVALLLRDARPTDREWFVHHEGELATQPSVAEITAAVADETELLQLYERLRRTTPQTDLKLLWRLLEVLDGAGLVNLEVAAEE